MKKRNKYKRLILELPMYYKSSIIVNKKLKGQFLTHPAIARSIVQEICDSLIFERFWKPWEGYKGSIDRSMIYNLLDDILMLNFVDPCMGDGVFLREILAYFERFLIELWKKTRSHPLKNQIKTYFKEKLNLNISLIEKKDKFTLDIWKFYIIRTMIYGVDLDEKISRQAHKRIIAEFYTDEIRKLVRIFVKLTLKIGNSLISPVKVDKKSRERIYSEFPTIINELVSIRKNLQNATWDSLSEEKLLRVSNELENQTLLFKTMVLNKFKSISKHYSLFNNTGKDISPFIWEFEFPEVFFHSNHGFWVVLGNPPWEKWKLYKREWLGSTSLSQSDHDQKIAKLQEDDTLANEEYLKLKIFYTETSRYFNRFYQWQKGEKNLYKLFIERFYTLCCEKGYLGVIVPGGLLGDYYSQPLRYMLLSKTRIIKITEIISNQEIFPDVEPGLSILIILAQRTNPAQIFPFKKCSDITKNLSGINLNKVLFGAGNTVNFSIKDIISISPNAIIPAIRSELELTITKKINQFPSLSSFKWGCKTSRGIDMTNDRHLLTIYKSHNPLIEGRHLVRLGYDISYPRYWIQSFEEYKKRIPFWNEKIIAWKNFSGNHRRRRMRIAILPPCSVISNSIICLYNLPGILDVEYYLAGIMCSIPFEFRIRQLCYGLNINQYIIDGMRVPIFNPSEYSHLSMAELVKNFIPKGKEWARRKLEASSSLSKAQLEIDYQDPITKVDALAALIFNLSKKEFKATMNAHPLLEESYRRNALKNFDFYYNKIKNY